MPESELALAANTVRSSVRKQKKFSLKGLDNDKAEHIFADPPYTQASAESDQEWRLCSLKDEIRSFAIFAENQGQFCLQDHDHAFWKALWFWCASCHLAPVHRCARSVCCVVCGVSWVTWLLFTGVSTWCDALCVRCPGPFGSCSPVCLAVMSHPFVVLGACACAVSWPRSRLFTGLRAVCCVRVPLVVLSLFLPP